MSQNRARPQNASFLQGLILLGLIVFAGYLLNEQGLIGLLLAGDRSGISYLLLAYGWCLPCAGCGCCAGCNANTTCQPILIQNTAKPYWRAG